MGITRNEIERVFMGNLTKSDLTKIAKSHDLKPLSRFRKQELIDFLFENLSLEVLYEHVKDRIETLSKIEHEITDLSVEEMLAKLTDEKRLKRGLEIPDNEVTTQIQAETSWQLKVKDYDCIIDMSRRTVTHNCTDWVMRGKTERILCKHLVKAITQLPEPDTIVRSLLLDTWIYR